MYTGLRFKAKLSDRGREALEVMMARRRSSPEEDSWAGEVQAILDLPKVWLEDYRPNFIPYGAVCVGGDDWEHINHVDDDGHWHVCCSLKNYTETIEKFLEHVLPKMISEPCVAESLYEEDHEPRRHEVGPNES